MSTFLSKIIVRSITKVVRSTAKFDIAIDNIMDKFKDSCPPREELLKIVKQKNQIQSSLSQVYTILNTLNETTTTASNLINTLDGTVKIIKRIPTPTAIAGIGIPVSILTTLSDTLDKLGRFIEGGKGALDTLPSAFKQISSSANQIVNKLQILDSVLNPCLDQLLQGMNQ
jgi:archaellum component FlaC